MEFVADVDSTKACEIGRWNERRRFRRLGPDEWKPRDRVLNEFAEITSPHTVHPTISEDQQWRLRDGFPEVPKDVLDWNWKTVFAGPMVFEESILLAEARSFTWALRWLAKDVRYHANRFLMFVDNFSLAFTIAKMRSSSFPPLQVTRRIGALRFATRIIPAARW